MALWHHFYIYINIGITNYNNLTIVSQLIILISRSKPR